MHVKTYSPTAAQRSSTIKKHDHHKDAGPFTLPTCLSLIIQDDTHHRSLLRHSVRNPTPLRTVPATQIRLMEVEYRCLAMLFKQEGRPLKQKRLPSNKYSEITSPVKRESCITSQAPPAHRYAMAKRVRPGTLRGGRGRRKRRRRRKDVARWAAGVSARPRSGPAGRLDAWCAG